MREEGEENPAVATGVRNEDASESGREETLSNHTHQSFESIEPLRIVILFATKSYEIWL